MGFDYQVSALCFCLRGPGLELTCHLGRGLLPQLLYGVTQELLVAGPQNGSVRHSGTAGDCPSLLGNPYVASGCVNPQSLIGPRGWSFSIGPWDAFLLESFEVLFSVSLG